VVAGVAVLGDEVDAGVVLAVVAGVLVPQPHVGELVGEDRVYAQVGLDQLLEASALVRLGRGGCAQLIEHLVDRRPHAGCLSRFG
jgi:hypothetical protein